MIPPARAKTILGADTSNVTSTNYFVGDFRQIALSITTGSAHASRITVQGSNANGFQSTLSAAGGFGNSTVPVHPWSHLTVITGGNGVYTLDPGVRWINAVRPTAASGQTASNITVIVSGRA